MSTLTPDQIAELLVTALERTAFVLADPVDAERQKELPPATHCTRIHYQGPTRGSVYLCASTGFLRGLASSLLGVEPAEVAVETDGVEALREFTNIMGGCVIFQLGGSDCLFSLGLPEVCRIADMPAGASCRTVVESEGEMLAIAWAPAEASAAAA